MCVCVWPWRNQLQELQRTPVIDFRIWNGNREVRYRRKNRAVLICNPNQFHIHKSADSKVWPPTGQHINVFIYIYILYSKYLAFKNHCYDLVPKSNITTPATMQAFRFCGLLKRPHRLLQQILSLHGFNLYFLSNPRLLRFSWKRMNAFLSVPL